MAAGYKFTSGDNGTESQYYESDGTTPKANAYDVIRGVTRLGVDTDGKIEIWIGNTLALPAFLPSKVLAIDGVNPNASGTLTAKAMIQALSPVFPKASTSGGSGGGVSLPSTINKAGYPLVVNADANGYELRKPLEVDLRDYDVDSTFNNGSGAAIQQAINELHAAGGGTLAVPYGRYAIDNALTTTVTGSTTAVNCQLVMPLTAITDTAPIIKLRGAAPPVWNSEGTSGAGRNRMGAIFESTILGSGTNPAVIGAPSISYYGSPFNYMAVHMENLIVRLRTKTGSTDISNSMCGIDASQMIGFIGKQLKVDITSELASSVMQTDSVGIIMPIVNNKVICSLQDCCIEGRGDGLRISEHFKSTGDLAILGCENALVVNSGFHSASIAHLTVEANINNIVLDGTLAGGLIITNYETEHDTVGKWYDFAKDIKQLSGTTRVVILNSSVVKGGEGQVNEFITSGTPNYRVFNGAGENVPYAYPASDFDKTFDDSTGWALLSGGGGTAEIYDDSGTNKLHLHRTVGGGYAYTTTTFNYTPGDVFDIIVTGLTIITGNVEVAILSADGNSVYAPVAITADGTYTLDTTGIPTGGSFLITPVANGSEILLRRIQADKQ